LLLSNFGRWINERICKRNAIAAWLHWFCILLPFACFVFVGGVEMNERIKELAEQAGLIPDGNDWFSAIQESDVRTIDLERFAELVRQEEREACAKLCESIDAEYEGEDVLATWCAKAIRARGNT
jgi:hypothetical protein